MNLWKNYIVKGNECFAIKDFDAAQALYEAARAQAEQMFKSCCDPEEAVRALIVTWHNMADLYQKQGKTASARATLERIHSKVLREVLSTPLNDKRHKALYRGSIETYTALLMHKRCHQIFNSG